MFAAHMYTTDLVHTLVAKLASDVLYTTDLIHTLVAKLASDVLIQRYKLGVIC